MAKTLEQIIGYETLTGMVNDPAGGIPSDILPAALFTSTVDVDGYKSSYRRTKNVRNTTKLTNYEGASREGDKVGVDEVPVILLHSKESRSFRSEILTQLTNFDNPQRQAKGAAEVARQTMELARKFRNNRLATVYSMIAKGNLYYNSTGDLLHSSSGATNTVDYSATTGNANIGAWDTTTTDIYAQLVDIKRAMGQDNGLMPTTIVYGKNIYGYLAANDNVKNFVNGNPGLSSQFGNGIVPNGLFGMNWIDGSDMWFEDKDGTYRNFMGDDQVTIMPDVNMDWYEMQQGSYTVPTSIEVTSSIESMIGNIAEVNGLFSYCEMKTDPIGIKMIMGDTWLPVCKTPGALRICSDVTTAVGG